MLNDHHDGLNDVNPNYPREFAVVSFAFSVVTGFCIGGTALSNVVGVSYVNKRLSLSSSVRILNS
jgi:CO dehydrogenase/acetyl-CoA synthase beta subunit